MKRKGISLIVLVITILVLAILATTVIISLNNTNIIEQAGNAVREHNLQTLKEMVNLKVISHMAEHNGSINMPELKTELEELGSEYVVSSSNNSISVTSLDGTMNVEVKDTGAVVSGDSNSQAPELIFEAGSVIPEGGTYYVGVVTIDDLSAGPQSENLASATAVYTAGQTFPAFGENDVFVYGDYEYRYNCTVSGGWFFTGDAPQEWAVLPLDRTKTSYGQIVSKINGVDVRVLERTFESCSNLVTAPEIPASIISMDHTFEFCDKLTTAPTIPSNVNNMSGTFSLCPNLTGTITINANPDTYDYCFSYTSKQITLTGSSTMLSELAATSEEGNVTVLN